jgi:cytochrome c5
LGSVNAPAILSLEVIVRNKCVALIIPYLFARFQYFSQSPYVRKHTFSTSFLLGYLLNYGDNITEKGTKMKLKLSIMIILLALSAAACGTQTPQTATKPASTTQSLRSPAQTQTPSADLSSPAVATESASATTGVSFIHDVAPIFEASCNKCHGIEQVKEGLDLTTYEGVMAGSFNGAVIVPGNANESYLIQQVVEGEMPKRGLGLTDGQIQNLIDWVNQGALNN